MTGGRLFCIAMMAAAALAAATSLHAQDATDAAAAEFDGYRMGMTVDEAERVDAGRHARECDRLMASRCITYMREADDLTLGVAVQFSMIDRRVDHIEITPKANSCDEAWSTLARFLTARYGLPLTREGNTWRWRLPGAAIVATAVKGEDGFCLVRASITPEK